MRDDFPKDVQRALASRVSHLCSNPGCGASTSGPQTDEGRLSTSVWLRTSQGLHQEAHAMIPP